MTWEEIGQYIQDDPTRVYYLVGVGLVIAFIIVIINNKFKK